MHKSDIELILFIYYLYNITSKQARKIPACIISIFIIS